VITPGSVSVVVWPASDEVFASSTKVGVTGARTGSGAGAGASGSVNRRRERNKEPPGRWKGPGTIPPIPARSCRPPADVLPGRVAGPPRVVLFDLDGVLRRFDPGSERDVEERYGLPPGLLRWHAFDPAHADDAVRGVVTRAEWIARAGAALGHPEAMAAFLGLRGTVDADVLAVARAVRSRGTAVGLLTNATDTLPEELAHLGLSTEFDAVLASCTLGAIKPEPAIYARATAALGLAPGDVAFVDDQPAYVAAAVAAGWRAHRYTAAADLRAWLASISD
jgi:HAD superfamily hydrolase (TIGR01509 family)